MKQFWKEAGLAVILGMIMPALILHIVAISSHNHAGNPKESPIISEYPLQSISVPVLTREGNVEKLDLDTYLTGVVLAEMPASFQVDALMAQAVVARTYTLRCYEGKSKHDLAAVCMDSACCQGYCSQEEYQLQGGKSSDIKKVRSAIRMTKNLVLTYKDELIDATYFSCSGGSTEDAVAVWGTDIPYLRATDSPGEENASHYTDSATFSAKELADILALQPTGEPASWFGQTDYTAGGGVDEIQICGTSFQGTQLRKLLGLRSTAFTVSVDGTSVTFHTRGFGHRVGMSQYGAEAMAASGCNFEEILCHYYRDTELQQYIIDKEESVG